MSTSPPPLPVVDVLDQLRDALRARGAAVLVAPPGTGKTTGVPLALIDEPWTRFEVPAGSTGPGPGHGRVVVVQPRRLAARSAARRMSSVLGDPPGTTVGWSIRGERRVSARTRVELVTGGLMLRRIQQDPALDGITAVLLDEFHERSIENDVLLALLLDVRSSLRPDLRLLVMSATLDPGPIARLLAGSRTGSRTGSRAGSRAGSRVDPSAPTDPDIPTHAAVPIITATAPLHPIETFHRPTTTREALEDRVATVVAEALADAPGDVLVFLPGRSEIRRAATALARRGIGSDEGPGRTGSGVTVHELHGGLTSERQDAVLRPDAGRRRRVVLATSVAETSITVPGVRIVVDAGRRRTVRVHPGTGLPGLVTEPVSMAGADQRRGRAGRTGPGRCYRLWSVEEERHRPAADRPEVLDGDLAPMLLQVIAWGATVDDLNFPDPPSPDRLATAEALLHDLGATDQTGRLTGRGRRLAELGFHPRLGAVVIAAIEDAGLGRDGAAELAALLETDLPGEVDLIERWHALRRGDAPRTTLDACADWRRRIADDSGPELRVNEPVHVPADPPSTGHPDGAVARAIAAGYRDRLARRRGSTRTDDRGRPLTVFQMVGGGEVVIGGSGPDPGTRFTDSRFADTAWIAVVSMDRGGGRAGSVRPGEARLVVAVPDDVALSALADRIKTRRTAVWDPTGRQVVAREERAVGAVTLDTRPWRRPGTHDVRSALDEGLRIHGPAGVVDRWPEAAELFRRLTIATGDTVSDPLVPPVHDDRLDALLDRVAATRRTDRTALAAVDVAGWILDGLTWEERTGIDRFAPRHLELPSGREVRIHYSEDGPSISTRLQDLLGLDAQPTVGPHSIPITIELLSPAGRPIQRTSDLPAFWRGSYASVRSEMRGRYPKHSWPERPWEPESAG